MKPELIERIAGTRGSQDDYLYALYNVGPHRLRIKVHIDPSYLYQSRELLAEVWRPNLGWTEIASVHYAELSNEDDKKGVRLSRIEYLLLERALWVLGAE